ncbi:hypothetical protein [Thermoactinospora rubra]|uniref:hypothetical protein n=1 Tax=Thermoactinospora rubra TaxID=1088767 RepID=UPI000A0F7DB6|nr:hypothetical protein [Thermoactinospora rubra]
MTWWTVVRFLHVLGAALWVGGQLTVSLVVLPLARRTLPDEQRALLLRAVGRRFGVVTLAAFLPLQVATGLVLAARNHVTWASLGQPGYGRILAAKLALFCAVLAAAGLHGWASGGGRPALARAMAIASLVGSVGVVLLATGLVS